MPSSLLSVAFFPGAFFGGAFVLSDAFRAVGLDAALDDPVASFISKKLVTEACAVGFLHKLDVCITFFLLTTRAGRKKKGIVSRQAERKPENDGAFFIFTYDLRLLASAALPLPFANAGRKRSSPES
jgi:hypothetical protein